MSDPAPDLLLTEAERERFAAYLEREAQATDSLAKQAATLGLAGEVLAKKLRADVVVMTLFSRWLQNLEPMTLGDFDA